MNSYNAHSSLCAKCYFNYILPRDFVLTVHKLIMVLCDKVFVSAGEVICTGNINLSIQLWTQLQFYMLTLFQGCPMCAVFTASNRKLSRVWEQSSLHVYIINTYGKFSLMKCILSKYCFCCCVYILLCWFYRENNTVSLDNFLSCSINCYGYQ